VAVGLPSACTRRGTRLPCTAITGKTAQFFGASASAALVLLERESAFATQLHQAEADARGRAEVILSNVGQTDWRAALEWLKRRYRSEWGDRVTLGSFEGSIRGFATAQGVDPDRLVNELAVLVAQQLRGADPVSVCLFPSAGEWKTILIPIPGTSPAAFAATRRPACTSCMRISGLTISPPTNSGTMLQSARPISRRLPGRRRSTDRTTSAAAGRPYAPAAS
jgi:hypothetical protein